MPTLEELKAVAKTCKIKGYSKMSKSELENALSPKKRVSFSSKNQIKYYFIGSLIK